MTKKTKKTTNQENEQQNALYKPSMKEPIFGLIMHENKVRIVLGNNIVSARTFAHYEEAEEYIASKPYELIMNSCMLLFKFTEENEKTDKKA